MATTVKVIADSFCEASGKRIITTEIRVPRIIWEEVLTHRMLSRSASGSRAIPVEKSIESIRTDPFVPKRWGSNKKGMQAGEDIPQDARIEATAVWLGACRMALDASDRLRALNVHKHLANRIIEQWSHISAVITATEWENFFMLRLHTAAAEEFQEFAEATLTAIKASTPQFLRPGEWHLPYTTPAEQKTAMPRAISWSVARCARVSYLRHGASSIDYEADESLHATLMEQGHMGPFEHQAVASADPKMRSGNFVGWQQYRKLLPNEDVWPYNPRAAEIRAALRVQRPNPIATIANVLGAGPAQPSHPGTHHGPGPHHPSRHHNEE